MRLFCKTIDICSCCLKEQAEKLECNTQDSRVMNTLETMRLMVTSRLVRYVIQSHKLLY